MFPTRFCSTRLFAVTFLLLWSEVSLFGQSRNLTDYLVDKIRGGKLDAVKKTLAEFSSKMMLLVTYINSAGQEISVTVRSSGNPVGITYKRSSPFFDMFTGFPSNHDIVFKVDGPPILIYPPFNPDPNRIAGWLYYVNLVPGEPRFDTTIIKLNPPPKVCVYRGFDRRFFTLPLIKKDISYLTFSTFLASAGTYYVFRRERSDAEENFEKYKNAKTLEEVSRARIETEKTRTHRNVARGVFFSATGTFAALLVRDLFFRKPEGPQDPSCSDLGNESKFACIPSLTDKDLRIDFQFSF